MSIASLCEGVLMICETSLLLPSAADTQSDSNIVWVCSVREQCTAGKQSACNCKRMDQGCGPNLISLSLLFGYHVVQHFYQIMMIVKLNACTAAYLIVRCERRQFIYIDRPHILECRGDGRCSLALLPRGKKSRCTRQFYFFCNWI